MAARFCGTFALEYEARPWDGVEGAQYVMKEVLAGLSIEPKPLTRLWAVSNKPSGKVAGNKT